MDLSASLSAPLRLPCGVRIENRVLKAAMTEGLADRFDRPNLRHVALYQRWAAAGAGIMLTGNVMVDRRYLERPGNVVVEDESAMEALVAWAEAGTARGRQLWMQISHPGRQCSRFVTREPVAPSAVQLRLGGLFGRPRALAEDEIEDVIARFARTAGIAKRAGFGGVQVHGAHGYLASQFLSPRVNQRSDRWGGTLENRARFLREAVRAVRRTVGADYPVAVKLNSSDFQKGAFTPEDACQVAAWLVEDGIDLLEISGGTYEQPRLLGLGEEPALAEGTRRREAYFLEYAADIRRAANVPLAVTGGFRTRRAMESALASGALDVIGVARPFCVEPEIAEELLSDPNASAPSHERSLSLGPGLLGPRSSSPVLRGLNAQAQTAWYYQQIIELAEGRAPDLTLSPWYALLRHFAREWRTSRARAARSR
jgi:2,4-dienoyl-CoA reductase-like NADH-dependent reductase (Old Yellow Enzyme family)